MKKIHLKFAIQPICFEQIEKNAVGKKRASVTLKTA